MPTQVTLTFPPAAEPPSLANEEELVRRAAKKLRVPLERIAACRATRISFDARQRERVWRVQLEVWKRGERIPRVPATEPPVFDTPDRRAPHVVIIGSGPAGLFAALDLLAAGMNVTVLERGSGVRGRRHSLQELNRGTSVDPDTNYCFGEGGAGTFSDGKLYTRSGDKRAVRAILETLVAHGAPGEILVSWRPHVGSNRLPDVVESLCETIRRSGGRVHFNTRAESIETTGGGGRGKSRNPREVRAVWVRDLDEQRGSVDPDDRKSGKGTECIPADAVILATGHSALDSIQMAERAGARLVPKGFAMGVRVEHAQTWLDTQQYGGLRGECDLPASFYEVATNVEERGVYSFCMCPGGFIVPATTSSDRVVVNGMSLSRRDSPFANSGLVVAIEPEDWCGQRGEDWGWKRLLERAITTGRSLGPGHGTALPDDPSQAPLFGLRIQYALEALAAELGGGQGRAPSQRLDQWSQRSSGARATALETSFQPGVRPIDLGELLPTGMQTRLLAAAGEFEAKLPGFLSENGQALGVESRTSSPVRIARNEESLMAEGVDGLFPCGEGAGYAGGIVSAAADGRRVAAALVHIWTR